MPALGAGRAAGARRAATDAGYQILGGLPIDAPSGKITTVDLPSRAAAMYNTWWALANDAGSKLNEDGTYAYSAADLSAAASELSKGNDPRYQSFDPIGLSQLFSRARQIANSSRALGNAAPGDSIGDTMVALAPWARSPAERAAEPKWQARMNITYTDAAGVQQQGIAVVEITQVLPTSIASLAAQMELRLGDQLATPPPGGTPRTGTLDSIDSITLLAI